VEKSKHVHIDIGGSNSVKLHFYASSKEAEGIHAKLDSSRRLSDSGPQSPPPASVPQARGVPPKLETFQKKKATVHFSSSSPDLIPPRDEESELGEEPSNEVQHTEESEEPAIALYDFEADGDDELSVKEGEPLTILEKSGDEWWKCRNANGVKGVVPASYLEVSHFSHS
jgi:actin cytoskeleton-regulatory complex protein SLA1